VSRRVSEKEFEKHLKNLRDRFGEVSTTKNFDGSITVMLVSRNKHAGTFRIEGEKDE